MVHPTITSAWAFEHYLLYLCLCIADSDCCISDQDLESIRCEAFKSWEKERVRSLYQTVHNEYIYHSDKEKLQIIHDMAPQFLRTEIIRKKTLDHLDHLVEDHDPDSEAEVTYRYIRKVVNSL